MDEFVIVVFVAFCPSIIASVSYALTPHYQAAITESMLRQLLVVESIVLLALGSFLYVRGWTLDVIGLLPSFKETLVGLGLAAAIAVAAIAFWNVLGLIGLSPPESKVTDGPFSPVSLVAVSVLNPIFEEGFLNGYVVTALKRGTTLSVTAGVSLGIRALTHVYQGLGIIFIIIFGTVLTVWYIRHGRLWPLIVAHVLYDFVPLQT
jgi:membrane protease YdiL (CAAX protease family)